MKGKKIINFGEGTANHDAVNKTQLDAVDSQVKSQVTTVNNKVTQNKTDIATITRLDRYYYFTDQLKHKNSNTVKFPAVSNNYPYSANNKSEFLTITLSGTYHIIYTDFYTTVIPINTNNVYNHVEIKLYIQTTNNAIFHGKDTVHSIFNIYMLKNQQKK